MASGGCRHQTFGGYKVTNCTAKQFKNKQHLRFNINSNKHTCQSLCSYKKKNIWAFFACLLHKLLLLLATYWNIIRCWNTLTEKKKKKLSLTLSLKSVHHLPSSGRLSVLYKKYSEDILSVSSLKGHCVVLEKTFKLYNIDEVIIQTLKCFFFP